MTLITGEMTASNPMTSAEKIRRIKFSVRCFLSGLAGLIPLLGLPFAGLAIGFYRQATKNSAAEWNPTKLYLHWGLFLACVGAALSLLVLVIIAMASIYAIEKGL